MLACIPTEGNSRFEDTVYGHFGSAPFFTLYDSNEDKITVLENRNAHHDHGTCHPMNQLVKYKIDCVICGGMGRRAIEALNAEGVKIYMAESKAVRETIEQLKSGKLSEIDPAKACQGHGQHVHMSAGAGLQGRGAGYGQGCGHGEGQRSRSVKNRKEN
ncbi:MAG: NifB/NifX family molybdenum-iron cluster-binding protein [Candidatus Zixiibacteriota bacterium]